MMRTNLAVLGGVIAFASACPRSTGQEASTPSSAPESTAPADVAEAEPEPEMPDTSHRVVFADRTSQGYLLLVDDAHATLPTREALGALARKKLAADAKEADPEVTLLLDLIATEPMDFDPELQGVPNDGSPRATRDLLGLHIDVLPVRSDDGELVSVEQLTDPVLTRSLGDADRASLARRNKAILLRVDYRNRYAVRGLRLLQTLVRIVAAERDALIVDPDLGETMTLAAFTEHRLRTSLSNVSDQIAVVPFPDVRHEGSMRMATRGMRRFASVDFELDGLPRDNDVLQAATFLLYGLAHQMVRLGEFDASGYAVELPQIVTISHDDIVAAFGPQEGGAEAVPACSDCPGEVDVHLVERPTEPHDPAEHVVARVIAPRESSDAPQYDHPAWARAAIRALTGR